MIIKLGRSNSAKELLIETRNPQGRRYMYAIGTETGAHLELGSCLHGVKEWDVNRAQGCIQWVQIGNEHRGVGDDCGSIKEALAFNKIEIE